MLWSPAGDTVSAAITGASVATQFRSPDSSNIGGGVLRILATGITAPIVPCAIKIGAAGVVAVAGVGFPVLNNLEQFIAFGPSDTAGDAAS